MDNIEQKVRQKIEGILSQQCCEAKRTQIMAQLEGLAVINAITNFVGEIEKEKQDLIEQLEGENRLLRGRLNMLSFGNNTERDQQILELYDQGFLPGNS